MKVYLSGPEVFLEDASAVLSRKIEICRELGWVGLSPLDNELPPGLADPRQTALAIYAGNLDMMDRADAIIANITPFRGPHMDPGTAFELGYMVAQGKPVMVYTQAVDSLVDRVSEWSGGLVRAAGVLRDRNGHQVENFGLFENLMIEPAATRDDHQIQTVAVPPAFSRVFVCDQGFLAAAHRLRDILAARPAPEVPSWAR